MSFGLSRDEFLDSTPIDIECYVEAERIRQKRRDNEFWHMGMYNLSAFSVALSKALFGRKSHAEYLKKPIYEEVELEKPDEELTEEEKERGRRNLLMSLQIMQTNFELNHSGGDE